MGSGVVPNSEELLEIRALLRLKAQPKLGDRGIRRMVDSLGSAVLALKAKGEQLDLLRPGGEGPDIAGWFEEGVEVVPMTSSRYPGSLLELTDPPPVLFLKGDLELLSGAAVAIVGSRRATEVGRRVAESMARTLAQAGVTVVSGMALGIDGAAHRGALEGGGRTVAVLGSGLRAIYPKAHRALFREIVSRGLVVSEFLPDEGAQPHHFPKRNRIIAALVQAVIVVEAGEKSGALITVDHGLDLGRDILAVPGSVANPQAAGSNRLLRDGARVIPDPSAILQELDGTALHFEPICCGAGAEKSGDSGIPQELRPIWLALSMEPKNAEQVATETFLPLPETLAGLSTLELGGWIHQCSGMRFRREG